MRVAPKNVQPSSRAALRNAKRAVIEMKAKCHRSVGSRERRMDLAEKVGCLASHKTYYKVAQRRRMTLAANVNDDLLSAPSPTAADLTSHIDLDLKIQKLMRWHWYNNSQVGKTTTTLTPLVLDSLMNLDSEIQQLMRSQWYDKTETGTKKLSKKKIEFAAALENLEETQRRDWLLHLA